MGGFLVACAGLAQFSTSVAKIGALASDSAREIWLSAKRNRSVGAGQRGKSGVICICRGVENPANIGGRGRGIWDC